MRRVEFIKPELKINEDVLESNDYYCKLKLSPLERGYGWTIGNSLRRVLLSSLPGAAIVAITIEGVEHEFCAVEGIREDVTEIILNLKKVVFTINASLNETGDFGDQDKTYRLELIESLPTIEEQRKNGVPEEELIYSKVVTAGDINTASTEDIKVINGEQEIATLSAGGKLKMELFVRNGVGYVNADENKKFCKEGNSRIINRLAIDSIFTPVIRCRYDVTKTRYGDNFDCDQLILEVWTNGSIKATNALSLASKFLIEHFEVIQNLNAEIEQRKYMIETEEKVVDSKLDKKIEDLDLSVRSYNCLKRANINTVGELTQKTEEEMMKVRNLGRKSLKEVVQKLREIGLDLKNSSTLFDDDDDLEDDESDE
ncbi:MAG: DNA-directed RNA polymerase subunit alpha [Anaeroplasma bactoclasticum]|nr:DNA-directed RNA polymerase subunit alpha [Anaeroplasma bactoclasticum]